MANTRLPLENKPMERAVIGALIADTQAFWTVKDKAKADLFTTDVHREIVKVLHAIADTGRDFSIPAIISRMNSAEQDGGFSPEGYLATLVSEEAAGGLLFDHFSDLEEMWARRQMMALGDSLIRSARDDNGLSAIERLDAAKVAVDRIADPLGTGVRHVYDIGQRLLARVQDASNGEHTVGLDIGLKSMQDLTGPLMPGRLYVMAGPPGSGKSALAYQVTEFVSRTNRALFDSLEMDGEELAERDLASRTGISADKIERASVNLAELAKLYDASYEHRSLGLHIDSTTGQSVSQIRSKAMRLKRLEGLDLLVIDHLLYIPRPDKKMGEFEGIRANMQGLKQMAKDLKIPVIVLTQLKKEFGEGPWNMLRRPNVNDLYGGSAVEQEADVILFVHRPEYLLGRKEPDKGAKDFMDWEAKYLVSKGKAELLLGKRRGGAPAGVRTCYFDGPRVLFTDQPSRQEQALDEAARLI